MKPILSLFALVLVFGLFSGFSSPTKNAPLAAFVTFINDDGKLRTVNLEETTVADWKDSIASAEFHLGDAPIVMKGMCVYAPNRGDAIIINFQDNEGLANALRKLPVSAPVSVGDRIIIDDLKSSDPKAKWHPIFYLVEN